MAGSGETVTYSALDDRSMQLARRLHAHGLRRGARVAVLLENNARWFEVFWAAMRSGLYFVPINWHLDRAETAAMIEDSGATALVTSAGLGDVVRSLGARQLADVTLRLVIDGELPGFEPYERAIASLPATPLASEPAGEVLFYSSGVSGRPKTVVPPLSDAAFGERPNVLAALMQARWGFGPDTVFLTAAPLYHAGPTGFSQCVQRLGGTVVVMEEFDPMRSLELIEQHEVTHALFVPMHFARLLQLPERERARHDLASLRVVVHGAAPCPIDVKERMIDWWGKILHEYYVGSEGVAFTLVEPADWLEHKGTVGKPLSGSIHILAADGRELPAGETGQIWFETGAQFEYHNDPVATRAACNEQGWISLGDVGHVDDDGWLYVTDRASNVLVVNGEAVYPQQIENVLAGHPAVADVAVIGVPRGDGSHEVRALVQVATGVSSADELSDELLSRCSASLPASSCPSSVELVGELPRLPTGKLVKRYLHGHRSLV